MNKWQKEVQQSLLKDEEAVIKNLEKSYKAALKDIEKKIAEYTTRIQMGDNVQSAIYQKAYQEQLKRQIESTLQVLRSGNYSTISKYLEDSYKNSYIGTFYDMQKQGVPLIIPINQEDMIRAITLNSKISEGLYKRLGVDTKELKKRITSEVTRGIASGLSWEQIAKQISLKSNIAYTNAVRIARTEGHRIQQSASLDAMKKAKNKGANIVKQWDATLDGNTRPTHKELDGQIAELDEPFKSAQGDVEAPGMFGIPSEDCNCRCQLLQRAKWALDKDSFTKMNGDTGELVDFSDAKSYNEFKTVFWQQSKVIEAKQSVLSLNYESELAKAFGKEYYDALHNLVVNSPNQELAQIWKKYESQIRVGDANYKDLAHCANDTIYVNGTQDSKGSRWEKPYQTTFHEAGHAIDSLARKTVSDARTIAFHYSSAYENGKFPKTIKEEVKKLVDDLDKKLKAEFKAHSNDYEWLYENGFISDFSWEFYKEYGKWIGGTPKYSKSIAYSLLEKEIKNIPEMARSYLSDILEGATDGKIQAGFGHGKSYWKERTYGDIAYGLATEAFAEMTSATFTNQEALDAIKKYIPKSYKVFEEMIKNLI